MRGLALKFTNTHQTENPHGFSEVSENKQLLIAIVVRRYFFLLKAPMYSIIGISKPIKLILPPIIQAIIKGFVIIDLNRNENFSLLSFK